MSGLCLKVLDSIRGLRMPQVYSLTGAVRIVAIRKIIHMASLFLAAGPLIGRVTRIMLEFSLITTCDLHATKPLYHFHFLDTLFIF